MNLSTQKRRQVGRSLIAVVAILCTAIFIRYLSSTNGWRTMFRRGPDYQPIYTGASIQGTMVNASLVPSAPSNTRPGAGSTDLPPTSDLDAPPEPSPGRRARW